MTTTTTMHFKYDTINLTKTLIQLYWDKNQQKYDDHYLMGRPEKYALNSLLFGWEKLTYEMFGEDVMQVYAQRHPEHVPVVIDASPAQMTEFIDIIRELPVFQDEVWQNIVKGNGESMAVLDLRTKTEYPCEFGEHTKTLVMILQETGDYDHWLKTDSNQFVLDNFKFIDTKTWTGAPDAD